MKRSALALSLFAVTAILIAACSITTTEPAPAPRATSNLVSVGFESSPGGAEIWINGEFVGSTNMGYALAPGKHVIELRRAGYETWRRELTVRAETPTRVRAELTPLPR